MRPLSFLCSVRPVSCGQGLRAGLLGLGMAAVLQPGCQCPRSTAEQAAEQAASAEQPADASVARLEALSPGITVRSKGAIDEVAGTDGMSLRAGDVVRAAASSPAGVDVAFAGRNIIHLVPGASLLIEEHGEHGAPGIELGAVVLTGSIRAQGGGGGVGLRVRSPVGNVSLSGAKVSVLDVSMEGGLAVQLGEVALDKPDMRGQVTLQVGQVVTLATAGSAEGIVVSSFAPSADLAPLNFDVASAPYGRARGKKGAARLKARGTEAWRPLAGEVRLGNGDRLHVEADGAVAVALDDHAGLEVLGNANVDFKAAASDAQGRAYAVALDGGGLKVTADKLGEPTRQSVTVAGTEVQVVPGAHEADVTFGSTPAGAEVLVRFGVATLPGGQEVRAGQRATVKDGKLQGPAKDAFAGAVTVAEGRPSVVYYQGAVPPIRFAAKAPQQAAVPVAFAKDAEPTASAKAELMTNSAFVTDAIEAGRTYWKVGTQQSNALDMVAEPARATTADRQTDLDDNGKQAHIYFQNVRPKVCLHWAGLPHAKEFAVALFAAADANKPVWQVSTSELSASVPQEVVGSLSEGSYLWRVTPFGADGRALTKPDTNGLILTHDSEVRGLRLHPILPATDPAAEKDVVQLAGDVEEGAALSVNGEKISLDQKSRFARPYRLHRGDNHLVFQLTKAKQPDRFYVRHVRYDG